MDMIGKIRRMHRRDKKTKREISRVTGLSRNTVAKWLDEAQPVEPKYCREAAKASKLSAHEGELKQALKADAKRPKKERRTAKALFAQIKAAGYEGGYTRVTDFIRKRQQLLVQEASHRYAEGQDNPTGVTFREFALTKGRFTPTHVKQSITFVEPGNVYKFVLDAPVDR